MGDQFFPATHYSSRAPVYPASRGRGYIRRTTVEGGDVRLTTPSFLQDVLLVSDPAGAGLALLAVQAGGVCQS